MQLPDTLVPRPCLVWMRSRDETRPCPAFCCLQYGNCGSLGARLGGYRCTQFYQVISHPSCGSKRWFTLAWGGKPTSLFSGDLSPQKCSSFHQVLGRPDSQFYAWRILFALTLVFSVFQLSTLPWCPQSPKFLYIKRRNKPAARKGII